MAFPTNWTQTVVTLPGFGADGVTNYIGGWYMQWWQSDMPIDRSTFDRFTFFYDFDNWLSAWLPYLVYTPFPAVETPYANMWFNTALGPWGYGDPMLYTQWQPDDVLPLSQSMVVRCDTGLPYRANFGLKFLGPVLQSIVTGDHLNNSGEFLAYVVFTEFWTNSFVSQGITFTASLCNNKAATLTPLQNMTANNRLGLLRKRNRRIHHPGIFIEPYTVPA